VKLGEAFGATGYRIDEAEAVIPTLKRAMESEAPVVLEVPIDYRDNPELVATMEASALH